MTIAALIAGPFGCGGGGGGPTPVPTTGSVEVGFIDSPSQPFQSIALNVVSVRLNPSTDASIPDTDPNWVAVTAPPSAGPGELSVNLLDLQNNGVIFNTGQIAAQTYHQIEVVIDASIPGTVIPSCLSSTTPTLEGCITANVSFTGSTNLRFNDIAGLSIAPGALTPLLIDINPGTIVSPASSGGNYTMAPTISLAPPASFLVPVTGTVSGHSITSGTTVTAELSGTNSVIATAPVQSDNSYTIQLPAPPVGSASYDLFVSVGSTIAVASNIAVTRGGSSPVVNFTVAPASGTGTISGQVIDQRTTNGLVGATVNLLLPETSGDNCATSLAGCVVVATTTSDNTATYTFSSIPPTTLPYYVQASTTGTDTAIQQVTAFGTTSSCSSSPNPSNCSFKLNNVLLSGQITVDPMPAASTNIVVTVMAEITGTGTLVGLTQVTVGPSGSASFSMEVPTTAGNVDLIASANDSYQGVGTQFSGHQLAVASNVNPAATSGTPVALTVTCMGHGTIAGTAPSSDANTHVRLFESNVQLMDTTVGSSVVTVPSGTATPAFPNQYSFCVPPNNTYTIQRFEVTGGVASPVGTPTMIVVPTPMATATATCPLCTAPASAGGGCPGNCSATAASPLNP